MAATILDREAVVDALCAEWVNFEKLAQSLSDDEWSGPSVLPGWSVADIVAHVVGTESMLAGRDVEPTRDLAAVEYIRNPIGELNEKWLDYYREFDRERVMADYREIVGVRSTALAAMTAQEFDAETMTPAGRDSYGRFMRIRIFDIWIHEVDILDSIDAGARRAPSDAVTEGWAIDEVFTSLPFVVGKLAKVPTGKRVIIEVSGLTSRKLRIDVAQRATTVEEFDGGDDTADVHLTATAADLARLIGGRPTADPTLVRIAGDRALGEQIAGKLHYLI